MNRERSETTSAQTGASRTSCGHPPEIYWINDVVWAEVMESAGPQIVGFNPCLKCAEQLLGREITL